MLLRMTALCLMICFASPTVAKIELDENGLPKEDMLKHFEPYAGRWVGGVKNKATDAFPEAVSLPGEQEGEYILKNTMFQMRVVGEVHDSTNESIFLYGFDRLEKSYCCWHYQQGGIAMKYKVEWAEDGKSYKQILMDQDELGYSVVTDVQLDEGKAIRWTSKVMTSDGKLVVDQTGELTPKQGKVKFPDPKAKQADKLGMFRPYTGKWDSFTKGKATEFVEEPYEVSGPWVQSNTLGGDIVEMRGAVKLEDNSYNYLWFYMYDVREQSYVAWFHDSRGVHTKSYGSWDADEKKMTWTLDDSEKHGVMVTIVDDLSEPDKISFTFEMESNDGKLIMQEVGYATQAKEE